MAEAVTPSAPETGQSPPVRTRHAPRFAALIGALVGIAIGAIALAAVLIAQGSDGPDRSWSDWHPSTRGTESAQEIANHVARSYTLADGEQLATVTGSELEIAELPAHLAVRSESGSVAVLDGTTVLFTLCGGGISCSIQNGRPSAARMLLLRREALELALYAFHELDGVDNVVALLPPNRDDVLDALVRSSPLDRTGTSRSSVSGSSSSSSASSTTSGVPRLGIAMLFRREQLETALSDPLEATLPPSTPDVGSMAAAPEAGLVAAITEPSLFRPSIVEGQDASVFLLLAPLER